MRVLLFVDRGDGRPVCVRRWSNWRPRAGTFEPLDIFDNDERWADYIERAARWWLVKCKNAEHGRGVIALAEHVNELMAPNWDKNCGRILASGGKA